MEATGALSRDLMILNVRSECAVFPDSYENVIFITFTFTAEDEAFVDGIVAAGHPASPGLIWNRHPPIGRAARTG